MVHSSVDESELVSDLTMTHHSLSGASGANSKTQQPATGQSVVTPSLIQLDNLLLKSIC